VTTNGNIEVFATPARLRRDPSRGKITVSASAVFPRTLALSRRRNLSNRDKPSGPIKERPAMPVFVLEPPAQYHHSYAAQVIERVLPLDQARQACAHMGLSRRIDFLVFRLAAHHIGALLLHRFRHALAAECAYRRTNLAHVAKHLVVLIGP